jgi:hypothetical protein
MGLALLLVAGFEADPCAAQDELLLNDDRVLRSQWGPAAARGATGPVTALWMDGRNGAESFIDYDIYLTTLRDPRAPGARLNRRLNDDRPGATQSAPSIAANPQGTFFCAWEDSRTGNPDIYGAALDSLGIPIGPNMRLNDDAGSADQRAPEVAPAGADRYLVVWGDQRGGQSDILGTFRTGTGAPIGGNITISLDDVPGGSYQGDPALAADASGLTLIAWLDGREGGSVFGATFDVYAQWLDAAGAPIGGNWKINSTTLPQKNAAPTVAADGTGGFVVAWVDRRDAPGDPGDIYAQRFGPDRTPIGPNVRVNDDAPGLDQRLPRAVSSPGAALLLWDDVRDLASLDVNVRAARVPYDGAAPGATFRVNADTPGRQGAPAGAWDGRDSYVVVWEDGRNGPTDIYSISIQPDGTRNSVDTQLNDDAASYAQWRPRIGSGSGLFLVTWLDRRRSANDLLGQWVRASGLREGPNLPLWLENPFSRPVESDAAVAVGAVGLAVAQLTRESDAGEIRGFLLPQTGSGPTSEFWISDLLPSAQAMPAVAADTAGFAVVWIDSREGSPRIYGQALGLDGTRAGGNHPILPVDPSDPVHGLDLAAEPLGGHWLAYAEGALLEQRLWLVHLGSGLVADRAPVAVAPEVPGPRSEPRLACAADGRVEVAWTGPGATGTGRVYHAAFDAAGLPLAAAATVGDPADPGAQGAPSIAALGSRSAVTWQGIREGNWSIWMQMFEDGVTPASGLVRVDQDPGNGDQFDPGVGFDAAGRILVLWTDGRSVSSDLDILARTFETAPTAIRPGPPPVVEPPASPPITLRAGPASPNPFPGVVRVPVEVPDHAGRIAAYVFNARGELMRTLHDGPAPAPRITLRWDGSDARGVRAASGVYWIIVEGGGERRVLRVVSIR